MYYAGTNVPPPFLSVQQPPPPILNRAPSPHPGVTGVYPATKNGGSYDLRGMMPFVMPPAMLHMRPPCVSYAHVLGPVPSSRPPPIPHSLTQQPPPPLQPHLIRTPIPIHSTPPPPPRGNSPPLQTRVVLLTNLPPPESTATSAVVSKSCRTEGQSPPADDGVLQTSSYKYSTGCSDKQKTAMCRVAELARFHKLKHEYELSDETGPAHDKHFTVCLKLRAGEHYKGVGNSIRKAQQDAARCALEHTKLRLPPENGAKEALCAQGHITNPLLSAIDRAESVVHDLNKLAESLRVHVNYELNETRCGRQRLYESQVELSQVPGCRGHMRFVGHAPNRQHARAQAAQQALLALRSSTAGLTPNSTPASSDPPVTSSSALLPEPSSKKVFITDNPVEDKEPETETASNAEEGTKKSPVSIVHEVAFHRKFDVQFQVLSETGLAHDRIYVIECRVQCTQADQSVSMPGAVDLCTQATGGSKKQAKAHACAQMVAQMRAQGLYPLPEFMFAAQVNGNRPRPSKLHKRKTLVKDRKKEPDYGQQINPVTRLIQVQQSLDRPEATFNLLQEHGTGRQKEFVMQCCVDEQRCEGQGPNKKLAKRAAAEAMLLLMGYAKPLPAPGKSVLKQDSNAYWTPAEPDDTSPTHRTHNSSNESPENGDAACTDAVANEHSVTTTNQHQAASECTEADMEGLDAEGGRAVSRRVTFRLDESARKRNELSEMMERQCVLRKGRKHRNRQQQRGVALEQTATATDRDSLVFTAPTSTRKKWKDGGRALCSEQQQLIGQLAEHFIHNKSLPPCITQLFNNGTECSLPEAGEDADHRMQIEFIAKTIGFGTQFTDFPRQDSMSMSETAQPSTSNGTQTQSDMAQTQTVIHTDTHNTPRDHLCLVTLGVGQPQVCHGSGSTVWHAQQAAAYNALGILAKQYAVTVEEPHARLTRVHSEPHSVVHQSQSFGDAGQDLVQVPAHVVHAAGVRLAGTRASY